MIVSHELVHAALHLLRATNALPVLQDECDDGEELLAYTIGHLCRLLVEKFHKAGLYDGN